MILETDRLLIRPITMRDTDSVYTYRSDRETNKYQGWIPRTHADVELFIGKVARMIDTPGSWFQLVLVEKEQGSVIGDMGLHFVGRENRQVEIGITLDKGYHGAGYATEAMKAVIDYLFKHLSKHRIYASIDPRNDGSAQLMERIGFRKEAHLVESLFIDGEWVDDIIYALLERDWREINM